MCVPALCVYLSLQKCVNEVQVPSSLPARRFTAQLLKRTDTKGIPVERCQKPPEIFRGYSREPLYHPISISGMLHLIYNYYYIHILYIMFLCNSEFIL